MKHLAGFAVLALSLFGTSSAAYGGLIGTDVRFRCPECAPPFDQSFTVLAGGPELTPFGQFAIDVGDSSIRIQWLITATTINPGHFIFSELSPFVVSSAVLAGSSTWIPRGLSFTGDTVTLDISGQPL